MNASRAMVGVRRVGNTIAIAAVLGLVASACGGGTGSRVARTVHLNGQATGNYVSEISASGTAFLLPASDVALQGSHTFDVVDAANANPADGTLYGHGPTLALYTTGVAAATRWSLSTPTSSCSRQEPRACDSCSSGRTPAVRTAAAVNACSTAQPSST